MAEFEERFNGKEDVKIVEKKTCDRVSAKRKHLLGVTKKGNKWRAKIHNPKLKVQVHLGYFSTPEEAALVVKKKKAEFKEMLKGEEAAVFADRKRRELYGGKPRGSRECAVDDKVLQETESEEASVVADRKQELYGVEVRGSGVSKDDDKVLQETEGEEASVVANRKQEVYGAKVRGSSECDDDDKVLQETESEEAAVVKNKKAEFEDTLRIKRRRRHEFEGRQLPKGVRRECGKFRVRLWHPELNKYASFGYYSTCEEAVVVADRKRAELQEVYGGKPRGSRECEVDDKDLQETENLEASVVADRKQEVYRAKVRGSGECEVDDKGLQETESEEAAVVADRKRREVYGGKVGGSGEVLQEIEIEIAGKFGCVNEQTSDVKVLAGVRRVRPSKRVARIIDPVSSSEEKAVLDTKMNRTEFEEKFFGKENVNIVQSEACDGVSEKRKQFFGVNKKGKKWQARIRHPKTKFKLHLGYFSTPEEAALVVKKKNAEFKQMLKAEEGSREKRRRHEFEGRKLPCGVRRVRGKFCVRIWHPELKKYVSFGCYSTTEEAVVVADRKRAELQEMYGEKSRGRGVGEDDDEVLQECGSEVAAEVECSDVQTRDLKVPAGVRRIRSGKRVARIKDLTSSDRIWSGTYDTPEEFIKCYYNKKIAVQMGSDDLNNFEIGDKLNCGVVDVPDKLECQFVHGSPTSNIEPGMSGDKRVIVSLDFDEAVNAGFINEYGQLVGKYRVLDEQLYLGLPDEIVAGSGQETLLI